MNEHEEECQACKYYKNLGLEQSDDHFVKSIDPWEHARDKCGIHLCTHHNSLMLLRHQRRMVNEKNVGTNGGRFGSPVPTFFDPVDGRLIAPDSPYRRDKRYWKVLLSRYKNRKVS